MDIKLKRRFRGWVVLGVVAAGLIIMFIAFSAPIVENFKNMFFGAAKAAKAAKAAEGAKPQAEAGAKEEKKVVPVVVFKVTKTDFQDTLPAMGTVRGLKEVELRFESNGVIDSMNFKEADVIKRGDIIAVLNQQDAILKLEFAQSKMKTSQTQMLTAKKKLEIHQKLYELGSIIKSKLEEVALEYENAKSQVTSAEKEVAFSKQEIQKAYLIAPIDGIVGNRETEAGEFVTSNTKIATIIDISSAYAEVGIIEKDIQKIALGQEATVTVDAYPDKEFKGTIDKILPVIEGKSRTLTCKIKINNDQGQLLPGMFARATIFVFGQKGVFVLPNPNTALKDSKNSGKFDSVFVVDAENVAHLKNVDVSYITTDNAVIASGLEEGEQVVTEARAELADGAPVEILETQEGLKAAAEQPEGEEGKGQEKELVIH